MILYTLILTHTHTHIHTHTYTHTHMHTHTHTHTYTHTYTHSHILVCINTGVTVGFINPPYSIREDEGPMIFTLGVTSGHTLDTDIELSFSTADIDAGGTVIFY